MKVPRSVHYAAVPALAATFPVLSLYSSNLQYPFSEVGPCVAWALAGGLAAYALLASFFRDAAKASLMTIPCIILFYLCGAFAQDPTEVDETRVLVDAFVELGYAILWIALGVLLFAARRWKRSLDTPARVATVLVAGIVVMPLVPIALWQLRQSAAMATAAPPALTPSAAALGRDIYYIVLDGYGRHDILPALYDVDNSEFIDALRRRGFYVAERSRANYLQTHLSLASSLNYRYIDDVIDPSQAVVIDRCKGLMMDNAASRFLKAHGYRYVNIHSGYWMTSPNESADVELGVDGLELREFRRSVAQMTPLWALRQTGLEYAQSVHQRRILFQLDTLPNAATREQPSFVVTHIVCPHPPFVFDRDGGTLPFGNADSLIDGRHSSVPREQYAWGYREQLLFISRKTIETVDAILARDPDGEPPVIIIQGDHGGGMLFDYERIEGAYMPERVPILNALLLPADHHFELSETMTPVNSFPIVFNGLFGAGLPLSPDRTYYVPWKHPHQYSELPASAAEITVVGSPR